MSALQKIGSGQHAVTVISKVPDAVSGSASYKKKGAIMNLGRVSRRQRGIRDRRSASIKYTWIETIRGLQGVVGIMEEHGLFHGRS